MAGLLVGIWHYNLFCFIIQHIPGKENITADYLSRSTSESPEEGGCVMAQATQARPGNSQQW